MKLTTKLGPTRLFMVLDAALELSYGHNVYWSNLDDNTQRRDGRWSYPRFTLETRDAWAHGSRTSASGRHMRKASWHAHRDALAAIFKADPEAKVHTAVADYNGQADFLAKFPATAHKNVGSQMQPRELADCSV